MTRFVPPVIVRDQYYFLRETLEESIQGDHPVRVFDFVLDQHDWTEWFTKYPGGGRPAYPPNVMCKLLVYGCHVGIRSSRALEHACRNNKDFIWLLSGRTPDHDTIAAFRRENAAAFKKVFKTTVAACIEAGMVSMKGVVIDGTRVAANNSSARTRTAAGVEKMLAQIDQQVETLMQDMEAQDVQEDLLFGSQVSPHNLPKQLKDLQRQQARLKKALAKVQAKAQNAIATQGLSEDQAAKKRVPITDVDSDVMKNKVPGFSPNYGPYIGVDPDSGVVLCEDVTTSHHDSDHLQEAIEQTHDNTGAAVPQVIADSNYATAANLQYCENNQIDPCIAPQNTSLERKAGRRIPAWPSDVPDRAGHVDGSTVCGTSLTRTAQGKFDKSAFHYDAERDCYRCPLGQSLPVVGTEKRQRCGRAVTFTKYRCSACTQCPFTKVCTSSSRGRTILRGEEEPVHARHRQRMNDPARQERYKVRRQTVEPAIGILKEIQRIRRFLLRGLKYVRGEWSLAAAAYNIKKLAIAIGLDALKSTSQAMTA